MLLKKFTKKSARGKTIHGEVRLAFVEPQVFSIAYDSRVHHRFLMEEVRLLTRPARFDLRNRTRATHWRQAILQDAPLLKGFFQDEPKWREKMLRWCDKILNK